MPLFTVEIDSFQIVDTRSLHEDTDYLSFTLLIEKENVHSAPQTKTKSMGNLNSGNHTVNLAFENVPIVNATDHLIFNYLIVNSQDDRVKVETALETVGDQLVTTELSELGWVPEASALVAYGPWLSQNLQGIFFPRCDGVVAVETNFYYLSDLLTKTASGRLSHSTRHKGSDSATLCGSNSDYIVNWHITQIGTQTVPDVFEMSQAEAQKAIQAAGLVAVFKTQISTPTKSPTPARTYWVFSQSPAAGQLAVKGSPVTMVLHGGPEP
jgi:PASTA domain